MTSPSRFLSNRAVTWLELCNEEGTDVLAPLHASVSPTLPYYPGGNWRADFCVLLMLMAWCNLFHSRVRKVKAIKHRPSALQLPWASAVGSVRLPVFLTALRHNLHNNSVIFFFIELVKLYKHHWNPVLEYIHYPQKSLVPIGGNFESTHPSPCQRKQAVSFCGFVFSGCFQTVELIIR